MDKMQFVRQKLSGHTGNISAVIKLFSEGASVPFIARYRKEASNSMDEVAIAEVKSWSEKYDDLIDRKTFILEKIEEQGKLTDALNQKIVSCYDSIILEDIYQPFKSKVKTKADKARDLGLEPFAKLIISQNGEDPFIVAEKFLSDELKTVEEAIEGAKHIIAEWVAENESNREYIRKALMNGTLSSKVISTKKEAAEKYQDYFDYEEKLVKCPSHRFLAVLRAQAEGFCRVKILIYDDSIINNIIRRLISRESPSRRIIEDAVKDAFKRLLYPTLSSQVISIYKEKADLVAIETFSNNLRQLLLAAPLGEKAILGIDPGFRTGCKIACIDKDGDLLEDTTIYPTPPQNDIQKSADTILRLLQKHQIEVIAIGNGTAARETESFINDIKPSYVDVFMVSENGASIYSASDIAREEFPDKDITVRGAVSIGRRLMDPLAELIKIDPKSIGVGQYQHDVNQTELKNALNNVVVECVNKVGVNLNTASPYLLNYISGLGPTLAQNIVNHRSENGSFSEISQLLNVSRLGGKAYEQCAGFLRINNGLNILDNTGVHPESYDLVYKMAEDAGVTLEELIGNSELRKSIDLNNYISKGVGLPTLTDIMNELDKPGLDIRGKAEVFRFSENLKSIDDVEIGLIVPAIVNNIANFGAFVDLGIKENGLLHISQIVNRFIKHPDEVLSLNQKLKVKIIDVDKARKRISVSLLF